MVKKVAITKTAAKEIKEIAEYLEAEYSFHSAEKFVDSTYEAIEKVQNTLHADVKQMHPKRLDLFQ